MTRTLCGACVCMVILCAVARVDSAGSSPVPAPMPVPIPAATDTPYPGAIELFVDATDIDRRIFNVRERIPVQGDDARLTLLYPAWMPGNHAPRGPLQNLAGLRTLVDGRPVAWVRDAVEMSAFHVELPANARFVDVEFQFLSPTMPDQGRVVLTPEMANIQWNTVVLYPAGHYARVIAVEASLKIPAGWSLATALELATDSPERKHFKPTSLETLIDSPVFAGRYVRRFDLDISKRPVRLNVVADSPSLLDAQPAHIEAHRNIVRQADLLFGARPFDRYDFLLALSSRLSSIGLEHRRSSENATDPGYFRDWDRLASTKFPLAHEYVHAWNGKYRRPADLWTADFNTPMRGSLLWVYEGLTQYWQTVLAARAGMLTPEQALDALAVSAAVYDHRPGRAWRSLADTTNKAMLVSRRPIAWPDWQRTVLDFYDESALIWLDVDTLIRKLSAGRRSLDDFARALLRGSASDGGTSLYTFDDVIAALDRVQPYDWRTHLLAKLDGHGSPPLDGLLRGGYRLAYDENPSPYFQELESSAGVTDLTYSIGLALARDGAITAVRWDGPSFNAGLTPGAQLVAVNGVEYEMGRLKDAVRSAREGGGRTELLIKSGDRYRTVVVDYDGGLRYPHLQRVAPGSTLLEQILAPL